MALCIVASASAAPPVTVGELNGDIGGITIVSDIGTQVQTGTSVFRAGDINGDLIDDVIVGAPHSTIAGRAFVIFGTSDPTSVSLSDIENGIGGFVINGMNSDRAGAGVAGAGDVNGDGLDDVIVGAPNAYYNGAFPGRGYVVFGKADTDPVDAVDIVAGTGGFVINGDKTCCYSAFDVVSGGGSVNGDGFDDILISADLNYDGSHRVFVVFGKNNTSAVNLSSVGSGTGGFVITSPNGSNFGSTLALAGNVNGDSFADIIVGAPLSGAGAAYVIFGKSTTTAIATSTIDAGTGGFVIQGDEPGGLLGSAVAAAEINGDGVQDLLVGAPGTYQPGFLDAGAAYVVFGKASTTAVSAADLRANIGGYVINGVRSDGYAGKTLAGAGDVNGDGLEDILVGGPGETAVHAGEAWVVFGRAVPGTIELSDVSAGFGGFIVEGAPDADRLGNSVSSAGDFNDDGLDDVVIGAPFHDTDDLTTDNIGEAYIVLHPLPASSIRVAVRDAVSGEPIPGGRVFAERTDGPVGTLASFSNIDGSNKAIYVSRAADRFEYLVRATAGGYGVSNPVTVTPDDSGEIVATLDLPRDTLLNESSIVRVRIELDDALGQPTDTVLLSKDVVLRDAGVDIGLEPIYGAGEMIFLGVPRGNLEVFAPDTSELTFTPVDFTVGTAVDTTVVLSAQVLPNGARAEIPGQIVGAVANSGDPAVPPLPGALVIDTRESPSIMTATNAVSDGTYVFPDIFPGSGIVQAFSSEGAIAGSSRPATVVSGDTYGNGADEDTDLDVTINAAEQIADSDYDGLPDSFEDAFFTSTPIDEQGADDDPDEDGLTNFEELSAETSPVDADSDNDGAEDGYELVHGSDPNSGASVPAPPDGVWVDFGYSGILQAGTLLNPFTNLADAATHVANGGTIRIKGDVDDTVGDAPVMINQNVDLRAFRGKVRIQ